jgi:DNA-binding transcriptional MerR regulator
MASEFIGTSDVARWLNLSVDRIRQLEREGILPAEKLPSGQRIFRVSDVEKSQASVSKWKRRG